MHCAKYYMMIVVLLSSYWSLSQLTIQVKGVTEKKGQLMVAVYENADHFPEYGKGIVNRVVEVESLPPSIQISQLVPGRSYAIAVYHDRNSNKMLDKNILGMPIEYYGFSCNARATFGPPAFESAAFIYRHHQRIALVVK